MSKTQMTTQEIRNVYANVPSIAALRQSLAWARETMNKPSRPARNGYMAYEPNRTRCARSAAIIRAELARRAAP